MSRQLVLDLPLRTALGREDFLVTPSNAAAVAMIDRYPDWPHYGVVLVGDGGSGKSHLLEVWRQASGARLISAPQLGTEPPDRLLEKGALAIDNAPDVALDERALFHLLNLARQTDGHVLIASETDPAQWKVDIPDLASRLKALPVARLDPPDDALLRGVLVKQFADRQLSVEEPVISYLMLRMPRSLNAARALVAELDAFALVEKTAVTRATAARVLQKMAEPGPFPDEG
ncbi:MAG: DnaA/Hda family protein [Alphaproteobacteria bacterium]|nr:DnaA/Hda family protein [Alphaproteobacteria bacterium]